MNPRAPKQWSLTKQETITSFEAWRQNLQYILSLDRNFAGFLADSVTWLKKSPGSPRHGLQDDPESAPQASHRTAQQKGTHLELMLGQIAHYCPVISRNTIVKNSTSMSSIWQAIRLHFGFQSTGAHFPDFNNITLAPTERPEDLYQRLMSFIEDNLLLANGNISHHGEVPGADEEMSPTLENLVVLTWLRLVHPDLPTSGPSPVHLSNLKFLKHWNPSWKRSITMSMLKSCVPRHRSSDSCLRGVLTTTSKRHVLNHKSSLAPCVSRLDVMTVSS